MRQTPDKMRAFMTQLRKKMNLKSLVITLAAIVVFTTTYLLILPAFTLDKQEAAQQGGIDVVAEGTAAMEAGDEIVETSNVSSDDEAILKDDNNEKSNEQADNSSDTQDAEVTKTETKDKDAADTGDKAKESTSAAEKSSTGKETALQAEGKDFTVSVTPEAKADVPDSAELQVEELKSTDKELKDYRKAALSALKEDSSDVKGIKEIKVYDMSLESDGKAVNTDSKFNVKIEYEEGVTVEDADNVRVLTFDDKKQAAVLDTDENKVETKVEAAGEKSNVTEASFETEGISKVAVVEVETIEKTVITADGKTYKVTVMYGKDAEIPAGATLDVKELTGDDYDAYLEKTASKLDKSADDLGMAKFFDITIKNGNDEVKIAAPVDVEIKLLDSDNLADSTQVLHFENENKADVVDSTVKGDTVEFKAEGFSVYAVVEGSTGDNARATVNFYGKPDADGNPTLVATYYVKNSDTADEIEVIVPDPGIGGTLPSQQSFAGWYIGDTDDYDADTTPLTIEGVREYLEGLAIKEGDEVNVYAMIFKHFNVTYYGDDTNVSLGTHTVHARIDDVSAPYTVSMAYTADSHQNFKGWKTTAADGGNNIEGWTAGTVYQNDTEITISGDVKFDVEAPMGNWLVYHANGKGGTYNAPQFYLENETTSPAVNATSERMIRNGYTFKGWYTDEDCTDGNEFTFGETIDDNVDIYAKWEANKTAPYTVILWRQNADRTAYEVIGSYVNNNGTVGQNIPYTVVDNGDEDYVTGVGTNNGTNNGHYTGFTIKDADKNQQVKITPEGDAVLNLHFDRIEYNFKFYLYRDGTQNNRYDYANNSGNGSALNDLVTWHSNQTEHPSVTGTTIQSETVGGRKYYYFVMNAYYGEDISSKWPTYDKITGANGREAVSYVMMVGTALKPNPTNQGSGTVKGLITVLNENILGKTNDANGNYVMIRFPDNYYNWRYHIWYEAADGVAPAGKTTHEYNGKIYYEDTVLTVRSSNTTDANQNEPKYQGFDYITRMGQNNQGVWGGGHWTTGNNPTLYHLNYIYDRQKFKIEYFDGNYVDGNGNTIQNRASHPLHESGAIAHGSVIPDEYRNYQPDLPAGEVGYVFEGWYLDEGCTTPYPWDKMPVGGIRVYAKWRQIQYRVFLHPNADIDGEPDLTLSWGDESAPEGEKQQMNFRISYGGKVSTPTGTRTGYEFVGWYRNPALTQVFSADAFELNESTVTADYDKTTDFTDPMDKWGNGATRNGDLDRFWITKKLELYGKWRKILEGADGINIVYDETSLGVEGSAPVDDTLYLDEANAVAQAASTPADQDKYQFLYWIVQKWDPTANGGAGGYVDTAIEVYPGESFTVKADNAKVETDPQDSTKNIYTVQLRAAYGEKDVETPTHIYWYANNGSGDIDTHDNRLQINQAVPVEAADKYSYPGHKFLGWARMTEVSNADGSVTSIGGVSPDNLKLDLGEDNLWLKWDPEHENEDGTTGAFLATSLTGDGIAAGTPIDKVAADERLDYHGLVAVWETEKYDVTIEKIVGEGSDADRTKQFTINYSSDVQGKYAGSFTLSDTQTEKIKEGTTTKVVPYGTVITVVEDEETSADFEKTYSAKLLVTETVAGQENVVEGDDVIPEQDTDNSFKITGDTKITVQNDRKSYEITFIKTDESGSRETGKLTGSTFNLFVRNQQDVWVNALVEDESMSLGEVTKELKTGNYKLVEVGAPNGYIISDGEIEFTINSNGSVQITKTPKLSDGTTPIAVAEGKTITVKNEPGKPLPHTGGIGTTIFYILGSLLVIGCGIVLVSRKRLGSKK